MSLSKYDFKDNQKKKNILEKLRKRLFKISYGNASFTLLIIPYLSAKKIRSLKFSVRLISIIVFFIIVSIAGVCIQASSYNSLKKRYELSSQKYIILQGDEKSIREKLNEYELREQQIKDDLQQLDELKNKLKDIIQSNSPISQSNSSIPYSILSSRGVTTYASSIYNKKLFTDSTIVTTVPEELELLLASQINDTNNLIDKYYTSKAANEKVQQEKTAIPSVMPVSGVITAKYGYRKNPFGGGYEYHKAIDIANLKGTPIKASGSGIVIMAARDTGGYGLVVKINHRNGYVSIYGHNSKLAVKAGDEVKRGQVIAYMGNTGRSTGYHCHFEVKCNGYSINPMNIK